MRVTVDKSFCVGHGNCCSVAPELFTLDQYGYVDITILDVPAGMEAQAQLAVDGCPERALVVEPPA